MTTKPDAEGRETLCVSLQQEDAGKPSGFHLAHQPQMTILARHHYRVRFWAWASPARRLAVAFYLPGKPYVYLGGPPAFEEQIKLAADARVNFVSFNVMPPWNSPGTSPDWSAIDDRCREVLDANPIALLIPRIPLRPPASWLRAHPDDLMVYDLPGDRMGPSVYSPTYRHDAAEALDATVRHLEAAFGDHVAGYHPTGQNTDEWFYQDSWKKPLNGYGKAEIVTWHDWVIRKYPTEAALRVAWNDPEATLAGVTTPSPEARRASHFRHAA